MSKRPGAASAGGPGKALKESRPWVEEMATHARKLSLVLKLFSGHGGPFLTNLV